MFGEMVCTVWPVFTLGSRKSCLATCKETLQACIQLNGAAFSNPTRADDFLEGYETFPIIL